eukprot:scaffold2812_cov62-Alexandrium_tamarense.AAC.1
MTCRKKSIRTRGKEFSSKRHTSIQIAYLGEYEGCEEGLLLGWNEGGAEGTSLHDLGSDG